MKLELPTTEEVSKAIFEVFDQVYKNENQWLLSALVPIDKKISPGDKVITYIPGDEIDELSEFLNGFNELSKKTENELQKKRIKILNYCHIMEADFPYAVIWNLLRILNKQECVWTFYNCDENGEPVLNKDGELTVLQYSINKINAIKKLANKKSLVVGEILYKIWQSDLRNSFSHSQYFFTEDYFCCSNQLSPLSRKDSDVGKNNYLLEDVDLLNSCASAYLSSFIKAYKSAVDFYKDGKPHKIHDGYIKWDGEWR